MKNYARCHMKKRIFILAVLTLIMIGGSITAYKYIEEYKRSETSNGMFVDRGDYHGYAKVHHLCESL